MKGRGIMCKFSKNTSRIRKYTRGPSTFNTTMKNKKYNPMPKYKSSLIKIVSQNLLGSGYYKVRCILHYLSSFTTIVYKKIDNLQCYNGDSYCFYVVFICIHVITAMKVCFCHSLVIAKALYKGSHVC